MQDTALETVLPVLPVSQPGLTWEDSPNLEGHPNGWPVLPVLLLSNSLSTCIRAGGKALQHWAGCGGPPSVAAPFPTSRLPFWLTRTLTKTGSDDPRRLRHGETVGAPQRRLRCMFDTQCE
jgi:hypothetical protein